MAWAASGTSAVGNNKTSASTWALWGSVATIAGEYLIVILATDNLATTDGDGNNHTSFTGSTDGETWTKLAEFTNGQGAAAAGATVSIWRSSAILDTSTPQVTANFSAAVTAKAFVCLGFTVAAGSTISIAGTTQTLANDGADPGSMTLGSLTSSEYLWIRGIGIETSGQTITPTTNWTTLGSTSSSGGGGATNMGAAGEYHIATGTTDTSDPTVASADCASILLALLETAAAATRVPFYRPYTQLLAH